MAGFFDAIGDFFGANKGKATQQAATNNMSLIDLLNKQGTQALQTGQGQTTGYLNTANDLASLGPSANGIYRSALGVNGDGGAAALDAYHTSPGYQFQMDQGLQALDRRAAASGRMASGSADLDTLKFSQGLADQDFQTWLNNLNGGIDRNIGTLGGLATNSANNTNQNLDFLGTIAGAKTSANNQFAGGKEANQGWGIDLLGKIAGIGGAFAGYGGGFG